MKTPAVRRFWASYTPRLSTVRAVCCTTVKIFWQRTTSKCLCPTWALLDTLLALIIVYTAVNLPLVVWIMYSYFSDVPKELLEAGRVDGAHDWQVLLRIIMPISLPGLAVAALLSAIFSWNEFLFAVTFTYTSAPTVPVFVSSYVTSEGLFWARMSMALSLAIVVPVLPGWAAQRQLIRGLTLGAVKG